MTAAAGVAVGIVGGAGLALVWTRLPPLRRPTLADRVEPYIRDVTGPAWPEPTAMRPLTTLGRLSAPIVDDAARRLGDLIGGASSVRRRLDAAGLDTTVQAFRIEQVLWGAGGLGAAVVFGAMLMTNGAVADLLAVVVLCAVGIVGGVVARDVALSRAVAVRERRLLAELPVVAELLALAVAAGEGPMAALERIARTTRGELSAEIGRTLASTRAGASLAQALDDMSRRSTLVPLVRFSDGLVLHCMIYLAHRFEGEPRETAEAVPLWFPVDALPYDEMWEDDRHWLPLLLAGKRFRGAVNVRGEHAVGQEIEVLED